MEYRFLSINDISNANVSPAQTGDKLAFDAIETSLCDCLHSVQQNYLKIGVLLKSIRDNSFYSLISFIREDGTTCVCRSVEEYAYVRFGLSKTVVSNSISIIEKFTYFNGEDNELYPYLKNFGYSALSELVPLGKNVMVADDNVGYLPKWVQSEVKPTMTVKELREVKKRHRKVKAVPVVPVDVPEPEFQADETAKVIKDSAFHIFKNDNERRLVLTNYKKWDLFASNSFLHINYYRINVGAGYYIIVLEWEDDSDWAIKWHNGVGFKYYVYNVCFSFKLDVISISSMLALFRSKDLNCPTRIWEKINGENKEDELNTSPEGGGS